MVQVIWSNEYTYPSNALFRMQYVSNVIYHNFSHGNVSYRLTGENVNVMLELMFLPVINRVTNVVRAKERVWWRRM